MSDFNILIEKVNHSKNLDFGSIFGRCFELFKKVWLQGFIAVLLTGVLVLPLFFMIYIPLIALGILNPEIFSNEHDLMDLSGLGLFAILIGILLFLVVIVCVITISIALNAAFFRIVRSKDLELNEPDDYFFFLKKAYLKKSMTIGLIYIGISILAILLCVLPILYAMIPLSYIVVVYAINPELSVNDIVKLAFKIGNKKWFLTFALFIVAWFLSTIVGFLMCFIGIYITQQFVYLPFYEVYKETMGFGVELEIDQIGASN